MNNNDFFMLLINFLFLQINWVKISEKNSFLVDWAIKKFLISKKNSRMLNSFM